MGWVSWMKSVRWIVVAVVGLAVVGCSGESEAPDDVGRVAYQCGAVAGGVGVCDRGGAAGGVRGSQ